MANLLKFLADKLDEVISDAEYSVPGAIASIKPKLDALTNISVSSLDDIKAWIDAFTSLGDEAVRETLLVRVIQIHVPRLAEILTLVGVFRFMPGNEPAGGRVDSFKIDWDRARALLKPSGPALDNAWMTALLEKANKIADVKAIQALTSLTVVSPKEAMQLEYARQGFGSLPMPGAPGVTLQELLDLIHSPLSIPLPSALDLTIEQFKAKAGALGPNGGFAVTGPDVFDARHPLNGYGVQLDLNPVEFFTGAARLDLGGGWSAAARSALTGPHDLKAVVADNAVNVSGSVPDLSLSIAKGQIGGEPALTIGSSGGTRLEVGAVSSGLKLSPGSATPLSFRFSLDRVAFVVSASDLSLGLLGGLGSSEALRAETDLTISYASDQGWQATAGADGALGVRATLPINRTLGAPGAGVTVDRLIVAIEADIAASPFLPRFKVLVGANAEIGPVQVQVDGAGVSFGLFGAGPVLRAEPPSGMGMLFAAGPISGGGFLDRVGLDEYAGALQLNLLGLGAFAYGIYKKLPSGSPSIVALIGVRFPFPGIQLSWGFALTGVGGLVGINRRADTDLLRDRLASGAAGNVLFNEDPVRNAPTLVNDLRAFFPDKPGTFLVGPTLQLNWLFLVRLDLGVFIELPGPSQIFLAGSARIVLGASEELALVYLRLDFIGGVDLTASLVYFDASLVNSHVLQVLRITGGCAVRLCYGPNGYFLFSVGGFHPAFNPGSLALPKLDRCGSTLSADAAVASVWLKMAMYFAVTPNTLQVGSSVEAGLTLGPIDAHGWFRFDAMIQFHPFYFQADIDAGFDIEVDGVSLCGVRLIGMLSGPGPIVIHGEASVKILFVRISGSLTVKLGNDSADKPEAIADLLERLKPELSEPKNIRAEGDDPLVVLRPRPSTVSLPLATPAGAVIWEQKRVPLKREITRLDGAPLAGNGHQVTVTTSLPTTDESDWFGLGSFTTLNGSEALNNATFVQDVSGVRVGAGSPVSVNGIDCDQSIDLKTIPEFHKELKIAISLYGSDGLAALSLDRSGPAPPRPGAAMVTIDQSKWNGVDAKGGAVTEGVGAGQAFMAARKRGGVSICASDLPVSLAGL
jgi:hypothetical protein